MEYAIWAVVFTLAAIVLIWLGIRRRRSVQKGYEADVQQYTGTTVMTITHVEKSVHEAWEDQGDGNQELVRNTFYLPTYEYTVDGKTYQYFSRQSVSSERDEGRQVTGYYDPTNPKLITENKPRRPIFGGFVFFLFAAFLLFFAYGFLTGTVDIS